MNHIGEGKIKKIITILIAIPTILISQYYLFKIGIIPPMIKGVEVKLSGGDYIKDIDKYMIKVGEEVELSSGEYIKVPEYAKDPNLEFKVLDDSQVLEIEGNKIKGIKEGTSSIGVVKKSRVLKKATVVVVEPKVENIELDVDGSLEYVGDKAQIGSTIEVDFDRFKDPCNIMYESSNENVLKIIDDEIRAVGVGNANIYAISGGQKDSIKYNISAKVSDIEINNSIDIEIGKEYKLNPIIKTSPKNLEAPKIKFEFVEFKMPIEMPFRLDADGTIFGIKEGSQNIRITCGNRSEIIKINIVEESITDKKIENLISTYEIIDNKIKVKLTWDYLPNVLDYDIYIKNNTLEEENFSVVQNIKVEEQSVLETKKVDTFVELDLKDVINLDIELYVVGKTNKGDTNPSNIISIIYGETNEDDEEIENLTWTINEETSKISLSWDEINELGYMYSVYVKNNSDEQSYYELYAEGLTSNSYEMDIPEGDLNLEVYIIATNKGEDPIRSNIINIK